MLEDYGLYAFMYLVLVNGVTFFMFGFDKWLATSYEWRVRERSLFLLMLIGGSIGAMVGMNFFRHKTRKIDFQLIALSIILLQAVALILAYMLYN